MSDDEQPPAPPTPRDPTLPETRGENRPVPRDPTIPSNAGIDWPEDRKGNRG